MKTIPLTQKQMNRMAACVFPVLLLSINLPAKAENLHPDTPFFTADQILNNEMPGRKESPPVEIINRPEGFATERLYHVPPAGQHPRVLFSREDLPRLRRQFDENSEAKRRLQMLRENCSKLLDDPKGWGAEIWTALQRGELDEFKRLWVDKRNPKGGGLPGNLHHPLTSAMVDEAFLALIDEDQSRGKRVAAVIASYARYLQPKVEAAAKLPGAESYWLQVRPIMFDGASVGFMYDFAEPFMTSKQAGRVRKLIAFATAGRYGLGMDLPAHWVNWNHIGMGLYFPLLALSIEHEEGYDPRIYQRACDLTRNYILHANSANGVGKEAVGYHSGGMGHAGLMMLAMANRGENLFILDRWRKMFDTWFIWTMEPSGKLWQSSGDLGTFPPNSTAVSFQSFFYPHDPRVQYVAANLPVVEKLETGMESRYAQLLCPPEAPKGGKGETVPPQSAEGFGLPLGLFDEERGVWFARTGWGRDDLALQVTCRSDTTFPSHDHPDRGAFYLSALGRQWAVSSMRMTEPRYLNTITIDGQGQGYFPPPGRWIEAAMTSESARAVMDLKYCYDWQWQKTSFLISDEQLKREPWLEWVRESRDRLLARYPLSEWERDPLPQVRAYYEGYMAGNPRMWDAEDSWVVRTKNCPVQRAFRSIELVRGRHPFVLIVDDIQKDRTEHFYQWRMMLPMDVEVYQIKDGDIILGNIGSRRDGQQSRQTAPYNVGRPLAQKGDAMLLVRVLQANQRSLPALQDNIAVETVEFKKRDDTHQFTGRSLGMGKRLVIPSRSVAPDFKVLLVPFREGDPLPSTELKPDGSELSISWEGQQERFLLEPSPDQRTILRHVRKKLELKESSNGSNK